MRKPFLNGAALAPYAVVLTAVLVVYHHLLRADFVFDDPFYLRVARETQSLAALGSFFTRPLRLDPILAPLETQVYRPAYFLYGSVACRLWGATPWAWHAANVAFHAVTACLALVALRRLFGLPAGAALFAALLWAIHPVNVQAVAWVSAVAYLHMGAFLLLAVLVACGWWPDASPGVARALVAAGAFAVSVLNHELGLMAPALAGLVLVAGPTMGRVWGYRPDRGAMAATGVMGAAALAYVVFRLTVIRAGQAGNLGEMVGTLGPRILQAPEVLLRYLSLLVFPARLTIDRSQDITGSSLHADARALGTWALCAVMVGLFVCAARRVPPLGFSLAWFLLAYFPASNTLIPLYSVMGEQYIYIAWLGIAAGGVAAVAAISRTRRSRQIAGVVGALLLAVYGARSMIRTWDWRDELTFNRATVAASPRSTVFHGNLGNSLFARGETALAEKEYRIAVQLNPGNYKAYYNLGNLALSQGRLDEAETSFRRAITLRADYFDPHYNLAFVAHQRGRTDEEILWLERALALRPRHADAHLNLGVAYLTSDPGRAAEHLSRFLALAPEHPQAPAVRTRLLSLPKASGRDGGTADRPPHNRR